MEGLVKRLGKRAKEITSGIGGTLENAYHNLLGVGGKKLINVGLAGLLGTTMLFSSYNAASQSEYTGIKPIVEKNEEKKALESTSVSLENSAYSGDFSFSYAPVSEYGEGKENFSPTSGAEVSHNYLASQDDEKKIQENKKIDNQSREVETSDGSQYLNPFVQPNLLNEGNFDLNYWGSGDVTGDDVVNWADYDSIYGSNKKEADIDGNGVPGEQADKNKLEEYLTDQIPYLPAHWDFLQTKEEKESWFENYYQNIDSTDLHLPGTDYDCDQFSMQFQINSSGVEDISESDLSPEIYDFSTNALGNMPIYQVSTVYSNGDLHTINAVLIGSNPENFEDWYSLEPQNDQRQFAGDASLNDFANIKKYVKFFDPNLGYIYNTNPVINFDLEGEEVVEVTSLPGLVTERPEWQSHVHIGGEMPENSTAIYQQGEDFPSPLVTGSIEGNAEWSEASHSDSSTQEGSIYDSTYYNYEILRSWFANSTESSLIDTTYGAVNPIYNRSPQLITVSDPLSPTNVSNNGDDEMFYTDFFGVGVEDSEWEDNSEYVYSFRDSTSTKGTDPTQCDFYNFSVSYKDWAKDPTGNVSDTVEFNVDVSLDPHYWTYFPTDRSIPFWEAYNSNNTGGAAEAFNPLLGDLGEANVQVQGSTQNPDTLDPEYYQYEYENVHTAWDTVCYKEISGIQNIAVYKPHSSSWTYIPDSVFITNEQGRDTTNTGGMAIAQDSLVPQIPLNISFLDSLIWTDELDSLFYRVFVAEEHPYWENQAIIAYQPIYQVYVTAIHTINKLSDFQLFPNPANDILFIRGEALDEKTEIVLFSIVGDLKPLKLNRHVLNNLAGIGIDVSKLKGGIYLIQLKINGTTYSKKFVKR